MLRHSLLIGSCSFQIVVLHFSGRTQKFWTDPKSAKWNVSQSALRLTKLRSICNLSARQVLVIDRNIYIRWTSLIHPWWLLASPQSEVDTTPCWHRQSGNRGWLPRSITEDVARSPVAALEVVIWNEEVQPWWCRAFRLLHPTRVTPPTMSHGIYITLSISR